MSYNLDFTHEPDYLHVQATGIRSKENMTSLALDYINVSQTHGYKKGLIDISAMTGHLEGIDAYHLGEEAGAKLGWGNRYLQSAIIDSEQNKGLNQFVEDVLVNRGFNVRFFSKVADAKRWLLESKHIST
jgi:hypothetical protein